MMKNISIIGVGKLGLCFSLTLEKSGYDVLGCDVNPLYVESLNDKTFRTCEQGVNELLEISENFRAVTDLESCLSHSDVLFVIVATPSLASGKYDHSQVDRLVESLDIFGPQQRHKNLVICCTTMPGYCDTVQERLGPNNYTVSYNPEFIAQGTILRDQSQPDMVLIGENSSESGDIIESVYSNCTTNTPTVARMTVKEAEICKISLNCFLTTKISFANMIGDIARSSGCSPDPILSAISADSRVSPKYLGYGFGFGGPCFPRDNRALAIYAKENGIRAAISEASDDFNGLHIGYQVEFFKKNNDKSQPVTFDYVTYKPESDMIVESQQLLFAKELAESGYDVIIHERPSVIVAIKEEYPGLFSFVERTENGE
jgi:UDPglucose 6-dehydrogenase